MNLRFEHVQASSHESMSNAPYVDLEAMKQYQTNQTQTNMKAAGSLPQDVVCTDPFNLKAQDAAQPLAELALSILAQKRPQGSGDGGDPNGPSRFDAQRQTGAQGELQPTVPAAANERQLAQGKDVNPAESIVRSIALGDRVRYITNGIKDEATIPKTDQINKAFLELRDSHYTNKEIVEKLNTQLANTPYRFKLAVDGPIAELELQQDGKTVLTDKIFTDRKALEKEHDRVHEIAKSLVPKFDAGATPSKDVYMKAVEDARKNGIDYSQFLDHLNRALKESGSPFEIGSVASKDKPSHIIYQRASGGQLRPFKPWNPENE